MYVRMYVCINVLMYLALLYDEPHTKASTIPNSKLFVHIFVNTSIVCYCPFVYALDGEIM